MLLHYFVKYLAHFRLTMVCLVTSANKVMFSSLSVCLLATLRENFGTDMHEIFREGWQWTNKEMVTFWWRSGSRVWIQIQIHIATLVTCALAEVCTVPALLVFICHHVQHGSTYLWTWCWLETVSTEAMTGSKLPCTFPHDKAVWWALQHAACHADRRRNPEIIQLTFVRHTPHKIGHFEDILPNKSLG